jgi:phosphotransferase system enzyme I (PtsI)
MAPSKVPAVRPALSLHTVAECKALAATALSSESAVGAADAVRAAANPALTDIL